MLELNEIVSGRLIDPKIWNRNVEIFWSRFVQSTDCLGSLWCNLCNKLCFGVYEVENGHGIWFRKEEPMWDEWAVFALFWDCFCMKWTKNVHEWCV